MNPIERFLAVFIFGLILLGGFFIAKQAASEPHTFSNGLHLQGLIQDSEESKVAEAALQGYIGAVIDMAWTVADESCTGTPDYDAIEKQVVSFAQHMADRKLAITPAWMLVVVAIKTEYPVCYAGGSEMGL